MGATMAYHVTIGYAVHRMCRPRPLFVNGITWQRRGPRRGWATPFWRC